MIIIDGREADIKLSSFENLQEVLIKVMEDNSMKERIITDIFVNKEQFSEIYPHQAEDIETEEIEHLEIQSVPLNQMARNITEELGKVIQIMNAGAKEIAALFRRADDSEALELFQDLLDVTRDFLGMISLLRNEYVGVEKVVPEFAQNAETISELLTEMSEVLENEDWILLSDLLEYEFLPAMNNWEKCIDYIKSNIPG
ncbi:MAG: hypothetical protein IJD04_00090 [Desulfovibrionaceae bacterium]|nr:hypothetical protein [Desulfovibrionaceae bacterium]